MEHSEFLSSIMHDVGLPLIHALIKYCPEQTEQAITKEMAQLLQQTIKNNDYIKDTLQINEQSIQNTELRLTLTALSSKIIAAHYEKTKTPPTDQDLKRIMGAIHALLAFSEDYIPSINLTEAYENKQTKAPSPKHTTNLAYIKIFLPLINAVSAFSFGLSETRMIQNVSERLNTRTTQIRVALIGDTLSDRDKKTAELSILETLAELYASCHLQEIDRISTLQNSEKSVQNSTTQIENIWTLFENRVSLLFGLAQNTSFTAPESNADIISYFEELLAETDLPEHTAPTPEEVEEKHTPMAFYKKSDAQT